MWAAVDVSPYKHGLVRCGYPCSHKPHACSTPVGSSLPSPFYGEGGPYACIRWKRFLFLNASPSPVTKNRNLIRRSTGLAPPSPKGKARARPRRAREHYRPCVHLCLHKPKRLVGGGFSPRGVRHPAPTQKTPQKLLRSYGVLLFKD